MRNAGTCLAAALLLLGCSRGSPTETLGPISSTANPAQVVSPTRLGTVPLEPVRPLVVTATVTTDPAGTTRISDLRQVTVTVTVQNAAASEDLAVEFETPAPTAYQRQVAAIADSSATAQSRDFSLPVAGTFIDSYALSGTWRAKVILNGQERTVASFELTR